MSEADKGSLQINADLQHVQSQERLHDIRLRISPLFAVTFPPNQGIDQSLELSTLGTVLTLASFGIWEADHLNWPGLDGDVERVVDLHQQVQIVDLLLHKSDINTQERMTYIAKVNSYAEGVIQTTYNPDNKRATERALRLKIRDIHITTFLDLQEKIVLCRSRFKLTTKRGIDDLYNCVITDEGIMTQESKIDIINTLRDAKFFPQVLNKEKIGEDEGDD